MTLDAVSMKKKLFFHSPLFQSNVYEIKEARNSYILNPLGPFIYENRPETQTVLIWITFYHKIQPLIPKGWAKNAFGAQRCNLNLFLLVTLFWSFMMKHRWTTKTFNLTIFPSNSAGKLIFPVEWGTGHRSVDSEHCTEKIKVFKNENWERKKNHDKLNPFLL